MTSTPSDEEIQTMLAALNRTHEAYRNGWNREAQIAAKKGLDNCKKWFRDHKIAYHFVGGMNERYELDEPHVAEKYEDAEGEG